LALLPPSASRPVELLVLVGANALATLLRFVAFRSWIFAGPPHRHPLGALGMSKPTNTAAPIPAASSAEEHSA
jgi:hypothetical protein